MRVMVYVEGASDKAALEALLKPLIQKKQQEGITIRFHDSPQGDKKISVMEKVPRKAVDILGNEPQAIVIAMPDLYPKNKKEPHETADELYAIILRNFDNALKQKGRDDDNRLKERFKVFCFKHELEALVLAAEKSLAARLKVSQLKRDWIVPVEDQNHDKPPKRVVEALFKKYGQRYRETADAPLILSNAHYPDIADGCPQCFKPFVEFLEGLVSQA